MIRAFSIKGASSGALTGAIFASFSGVVLAAPPDSDAGVGGAPEAAPGEESAPAPPSDAPAEGAAKAAPASGVEMPKFVEGPSPAYPAGAGAGDARAVGLRLSLDTSGAVTAAEIMESAGAAFDEEALRVAKAYRFTPATRDGVPIAVRISVRVEFAPPAAEQPNAAAGAPIAAAGAAAPREEAAAADAAGEAGREGEAVGAPPKITASEDEVRVLGDQSEAEKLQRSADSVTVIDLDEEKQSSSDMGEVLARVPGVVVRRAGGVGSDVRISINGLYDRSVRQFVDGVPLWISGLTENTGALPVNLFERVEVYRGVVPLRLSADALGGAINFVTDRSYENHLAASLDAGSFGTARGSMLAQYRQEGSNFVARVTGYADDVKNDYFVDVEVPDARGRLSPATVPLFHNQYSAWGVAAEAGYVEKAWAKRFLLRGSVSSSNKELQHNTVMTVPYGEVWYGDVSANGALIYDQDFGERDQVHLETVTNYAHRANDFVDMGEYIYDWHGDRAVDFDGEVRVRRVPGEVTAAPIDQTIWRNAVFHRSMLEWEVTPEHVLQASATPLFTSQFGEDRTDPDPSTDALAIENRMANVIAGLGHEWNVIPMPKAPNDKLARRRGTDFRFQNVLNFKSYYYNVDSTEALAGGGFREQDRETLDFGVGDGMRFSITEWLFLKGSYEYARRLPDPFEVFGDGVLVMSNLTLNPEVSHNANFGPLVDVQDTKVGDIVAMANLAYRDTDNQIVLLGSDRFFTYQNVYRAVTWAGEGGLSWTSPLDYVTFDGSLTYNDSRNRSDDGAFAAYAGDPMPNRSPFGASWAIRFSFKRVFQPGDRLEPFYQGRYTEGFFRGWESQGLTQYKQTVDDQVAQDLGITYVKDWSHARLTSTFEVHNFTDAKLFDDYGVQRPGRAFYVKLTAQVF